MKNTLTASIILSITVLVRANKDDHSLNLRGAHHLHGDDNESIGDIGVSRLLNDGDNIDNYYDNAGMKNDNENGNDEIYNNDDGYSDDDEDDNDDYNGDGIEDDDDDGKDKDDDDYYDDDEIDNVNKADDDDGGKDEDDDDYYDDDENDDGKDEDGDDYYDNDEIKNVNDDDNDDDSDGVPSEDDIRSKQIRNYRDGKALLINVHITHHGGTTFCGIMKKLGPAPQSACNGGDNWNFPIPRSSDRPWTFSQTSEYIPIVREHFHMIGWEFGFKPHRPLSGTDWENPLLVSVLIVKDPIDRLFGGSSSLNKKYGQSDHRNQTAWWEYAQRKETNNYALHKLTPSTCRISGADTSLECLKAAQDLVKRFTFVIDIACLDESMAVLADQLGWTIPPPREHHTHPSAAERFGNATLHDWLRQRNRRDIELYEWAQHRAVLNCSALS